jgi:hypothetical protein
MSAHTPGPWLKFGASDDEGGLFVEASDGTRICDVAWPVEFEDLPRAAADARLIAAAPELLAEATNLRSAVAHAITMLDVGRVDVARDVLSQVMRQTGDALRKAEGSR